MDDGEEPKVRKLEFDDDSTAADSTAADSTPVTDEAMIDAIIANEAPAEDAENAVDDEVLANQPSEEDAAKEAELQRWDEYGAYSIVSRESAESRPLSLVWFWKQEVASLRLGYARDLSAGSRNRRMSCIVQHLAQQPSNCSWFWPRKWLGYEILRHLTCILAHASSREHIFGAASGDAARTGLCTPFELHHVRSQ